MSGRSAPQANALTLVVLKKNIPWHAASVGHSYAMAGVVRTPHALTPVVWKNYAMALAVRKAYAVAGVVRTPHVVTFVVWKKYALTLCVWKANALALVTRKVYMP